MANLFSIHAINIFLIIILDVFSLELECGCHEARIRCPNFFAQSYGAWNFELLQFACKNEKEKKNRFINQIPSDL